MKSDKFRHDLFKATQPEITRHWITVTEHYEQVSFLMNHFKGRFVVCDVKKIISYRFRVQKPQFPVRGADANSHKP